MDDNEDLDPPPAQDILNVFAAADLLSRSSSDSAKYKCACIKAIVIHSYILSDWKCPYACSRELSNAPNLKEIASIMAVNSAIFPKQYANAITRHKEKKNIVPCNSSR